MRRFSVLFLNVLLISVVSYQETLAQVKTKTPPSDQTEDVVRVKTELVQTDVTVVDKRGRFVDGLSADDFELRVDSRPQPLAFFEQVDAGGLTTTLRFVGERLPSLFWGQKLIRKNALFSSSRLINQYLVLLD